MIKPNCNANYLLYYNISNFKLVENYLKAKTHIANKCKKLQNEIKTGYVFKLVYSIRKIRLLTFVLSPTFSAYTQNDDANNDNGQQQRNHYSQHHVQ